MNEACESTGQRPEREAATQLAELRAQIDRVDREILDRLNARARLAQSVGEWKHANGAPIYAAAREREILEALVRSNRGPFPNASIPNVFREVIAGCRSLEQRLRVAYLGPAGTNAHEAARQQFGSAAELVPLESISAIFAAVERSDVELGVVPIENTTEGPITQSYDCLAESTVTLCAEVVSRISHQLLSRAGRREEIRRVASHPQALAQCREWIASHMPGIEIVASASTAAAAKLASEEPGVAAIASATAGDVYGLRTLAAGIEDRRDNTTRFLVIGREAPAPSGRDLTCAVFTVRKDASGALLRLLEPFAEAGVNLAAIQARPLKGRPFEYLFFLDLEGHQEDPAVRFALGAAAERSLSHRVVGSFPRARSAGGA